MSIIDRRRDQLFPILPAIEREAALRFASGPTRRYTPGEVLFNVGATESPAFLILSGRVEIARRDGLGRASVIVVHEEGEITGEISQLAGRPTLAEGRAGPEGCEVAPFDAVHLRALVVGSADIGEIVMRAFILRRTELITGGGAGSILIGRASDPWLVRLQGFLRRNGYPYTVLEVGTNPDATAAVEKFAVAPEDLPIAICPNGSLLKRPSEAELGICFGITPTLNAAKVYDVAVVGAGPAGLATAVYASSEGLSTIVLDSVGFGGQAGASARIENYFGFPTGISGQALTARAFNQAQKFGAEIAMPLEVAKLECGGELRRPKDPLKIELKDGRSLLTRSVVVASGVRYRRPSIRNLEAFEGAGVAYWASPVEAKLCEGEDVALVGAGNSAGQAVVFLAPKVRRLHLFVRSNGLEASMSRYLIDRIAALANVEVYTDSEVVELDGEPEIALATSTVTNRKTGETRIFPIRGLFLFIGADPNTGWLQSCGMELDEKGFVATELSEMDGAIWRSFKRKPLPLETSVPCVFAIGDVRANSTKRVAAAVGEGAAVVAQLHSILTKRN